MSILASRQHSTKICCRYVRRLHVSFAEFRNLSVMYSILVASTIVLCSQANSNDLPPDTLRYNGEPTITDDPLICPGELEVLSE